MPAPFVAMVSPEVFAAGGPYVEVLRASGVTIRYPRNPYFGRGLDDLDAHCEELEGVDGVVASMEPYDAATLDRLPRLRIVARAGVGYDMVDVPAATERGVAVTITPTANYGAAAELTLGLLFALTKRIVVNDREIRAGDWPRQPLVSLRGKTLGIVGLGRIGKAVAHRAAAFEMKILACDAAPQPEYALQRSIKLVGLDELLERSDFVTLHCPSIPATRRLMNGERLARMKRGSYLVNTSRGPIIDEAALHDAIVSGHLAGAALDVFDVEPPAPDHPLLALPQVVVSPHMAGLDERSLDQMAVEAAQCVASVATGGWPAHALVNPEVRGAYERRFGSA